VLVRLELEAVWGIGIAFSAVVFSGILSDLLCIGILIGPPSVSLSDALFLI
jgi:hypothetical protein